VLKQRVQQEVDVRVLLTGSASALSKYNAMMAAEGGFAVLLTTLSFLFKT